MKKKICAYSIAVLLMVISFFLPPQGVIDNSVLFASGIIIFGFEFCFGKTVKTFNITREGIKIETFDKDKDV